MIDKLELLLALAREKHFARAAADMGVSQPAVSARIKQLEEMFGVLLVQRGPRFMGFTAEGECVLDWARRIVSSARIMKEEISSLKRGMVGQLRISSIPAAYGIIPLLTSAYRRRHPNIRFQIVSSTSAETLSSLDNLETDAGITYLDDISTKKVIATPIYQERFLFLASRQSRLSQNDHVTWHEISEQPLCIQTPEIQSKVVDLAFREAGIHLKPALISDSTVVLYAHVRSGRWCSIFPEKLIAALGVPETIHAIPIANSPSQVIGLVIPPHSPMSPMIAALLKVAQEVSVKAAA